MRKVAIFVLGAVLVGANLSHAMETTSTSGSGSGSGSELRPNGDSLDHHDSRRDRSRTLMNCRFVGIGMPLPPPLPVPGGIGKGPGKDPTLGAPGMVPGAFPGAVPGAVPPPVGPGMVPGAVPGPFPGYAGFGPGMPLPAGPVGVGPIPLMNNCSAVARLIDRDHNREEDDWDGDDRFFRNEFAVSCEGIPVYADTGIRSRIDGFEFLTGIVGDPILKVVRDHALDRFDDDCNDRNGGEHCRHDRRSGIVPAWLNIRGRILEGFCAVERERHHDDDHGGGLAATSLK